MKIIISMILTLFLKIFLKRFNFLKIKIHTEGSRFPPENIYDFEYRKYSITLFLDIFLSVFIIFYRTDHMYGSPQECVLGLGTDKSGYSISL